MKRTLNLLALCCLAVGANAQNMQTAQAGQSATPLSYAPIDADGKICGPWQPYQTVGTDFTPNTIIFDQYEADPTGTGAPTDFRLPVFYPATPGTRTLYGTTRPDNVNDFTVAPGFKGQAVQKINVAWRHQVTENFLLAVRIYDTYSDTLPPAGNFVSGIIFNFGNLTGAAGYRWSSLNTGNLRLRMPSDGVGATRLSMLSNTSPITYCTDSQAMLWVVKTGYPELGSQLDGYWHDRIAPIGSYNDFLAYVQGERIDGKLGTPATNVNNNPYGTCIGYYNNASLITTIGSEFLGGLANVDTSDDSYYTFLPDEVTLSAQCELTALVAEPNVTTPELTINSESSVARSGIQASLRVLNPNTNTWTFVDGWAAGNADLVRSTTLTGTTATDHIDASVGNEGQVKARLTFAPINDEDPSQDGWEHRVDVFTISTNL